MSISEPVGNTAGDGSSTGGKTPPIIGLIVKYHLFPDKFVPAVIEGLQPNYVELTYFYKGQTHFAVAAQGTKTYEYSY